MLPAERREVLQQVLRDRPAKAGEMHAGGLQVGRVPQNDGTGDEVERTRTMTLRLQRVVANTADAMEEDGVFQRIFCFPLVKFSGGAATLFGLLDPVEHEQCTFDAPNFAQCQCQAIGAWIGSEPFQHDRCADDACADLGSQTQHVVPVRSNQTFVDPACDQRRDIGAGFDAVEQVETTGGDIRDTRREPDSKQVA